MKPHTIGIIYCGVFNTDQCSNTKGNQLPLMFLLALQQSVKGFLLNRPQKWCTMKSRFFHKRITDYGNLGTRRKLWITKPVSCNSTTVIFGCHTSQITISFFCGSASHFFWFAPTSGLALRKISKSIMLQIGVSMRVFLGHFTRKQTQFVAPFFCTWTLFLHFLMQHPQFMHQIVMFFVIYSCTKSCFLFTSLHAPYRVVCSFFSCTISRFAAILPAPNRAWTCYCNSAW